MASSCKDFVLFFFFIGQDAQLHLLTSFLWLNMVYEIQLLPSFFLFPFFPGFACKNPIVEIDSP
jgi:hypothetical protein